MGKAKAPKPKQGGYEALAAREERARKVFRVSVRESDISFEYRPYGIPVRVRGIVKEQTGESVDEFLFARGAVDVSTYVDMWWISRLCSGETGPDRRPVSRIAVQEEFDDLCPGASLDDIEDIEITDEVDDSPEA